MRVISQLRDRYDYLAFDRDPKARIFNRPKKHMFDIREDTFFTSIEPLNTVKELDTYDATMTIRDLFNPFNCFRGVPRDYSRYGREVCILVIGGKIKVFYSYEDKDGKDNTIDISNNYMYQEEMNRIPLAAMLRRIYGSPLLLLKYDYRNKYIKGYIPLLSAFGNLLNMTDIEIVQEIENAIIADNPDPAMPNITDKDRIIQHGFDLKTSFRKR